MTLQPPEAKILFPSSNFQTLSSFEPVTAELTETGSLCLRSWNSALIYLQVFFVSAGDQIRWQTDDQPDHVTCTSLLLYDSLYNVSSCST
jgi:hypothetical protein